MEENKQYQQDRPALRDQFSEVYIDYKKILDKHGVVKGNVGKITSHGDARLFGQKTSLVKKKMEIPNNHSLSDYLSPVPLVARTLAIAMTNEAAQRDNLQGYFEIRDTHNNHNSELRKTLLGQAMIPENFPKLDRIQPSKGLKGFGLIENNQEELREKCLIVSIEKGLFD